MAIDKAGEWWKSEVAADIRPYLSALTNTGYPATEYRQCACRCGSTEFHAEYDSDEGLCRRICSECKFVHYICDSDEFWEEGNPEALVCAVCQEMQFNLMVGFAFYEVELKRKWFFLKQRPKFIRWIYVGCRCTNCKVLGCYAEWKSGSENTRKLMDMV